MPVIQTYLRKTMDRKQLIEKILNLVINNIEMHYEHGCVEWIRDVLLEGRNFPGYINMSDDELQKKYEEVSKPI